MRKCIAMIVSAALLLSSLTGCTGGSDSSAPSTKKEDASAVEPASAASKAVNDVNVVFIPKLSGNPFFETANIGAQEMAKKVGFTCKYDGSPEVSAANQVEIINRAVKQGANAIVLSPADSNGANEDLQAARDAGVKVVCWDSDVNNKYRSIYVAPGTPEQLGEMLVEMTASQMTDAQKRDAKIAFHYSSAAVADQNSWVAAARECIKKTYPGWKEIAEPYYSEQDAEKAVMVGETVLMEHSDIDAVICPDFTALPAQAQAAKNLGKSGKVIITGFASPNSMRSFCKDGTVPKFGLWDCKVQGAMSVYIGCWLAQGNTFKVGDEIDIPNIGKVKIHPNTVLDSKAYTADDSGVVVLPQRIVFDKKNIDNYNF